MVIRTYVVQHMAPAVLRQRAALFYMIFLTLPAPSGTPLQKHLRALPSNFLLFPQLPGFAGPNHSISLGLTCKKV